MKICIYSPKFYPSVGGLENLTLMLAREFEKMGHHVSVISKDLSDGTDCGVRVYYRPGFLTMLRLFLTSDVLYMPNIALSGCWLKIFAPFKRWVVSHNGWYERSEGIVGWQDQLKLFLTRVVSANISVSHVVAAHLPVKSIVIHNSYDKDIFYKDPSVKRNKDLLFVGRLVSDKGASLLMDACIDLWDEGLNFSLTITGDGPEKNMLMEKAAGKYPVEFTGIRKDGALRTVFNEHKILVVPSVWKEPFGIVALEGLACGCDVLCSDEGGLPEAVSSFGLCFKRNSVADLREKLKQMLSGAWTANKTGLNKFLDQHSPHIVAEQYINVFAGK